MTDTQQLQQSSDPTADHGVEPVTTAVDPRHERRIEIMQQLFAYSFREKEEERAQFLTNHPEIAELIADLPVVDAQLQPFAAERPLSDINKVDLAILRSCVFEWKTKHTPKKVLIDEAVELAKEFGTESSPKFINGVLAHLFE